MIRLSNGLLRFLITTMIEKETFLETYILKDQDLRFEACLGVWQEDRFQELLITWALIQPETAPEKQIQ